MNENMSKRVYFTATIIMLLVLFMFLFSGVVRKKYNDYDINPYEDMQNKIFTSNSIYSVKTQEKDVLTSSNRFVVYIGKNDSDTGKTVHSWCEYTKRNLLNYLSIQDYSTYNQRYPDAILLDCNYVDYNTDTTVIDSLVNYGINIIFCNMPEYKVMDSNSKLREICGVTLKKEKVETTGVKLFEGFLIGGEKWYIPENEEKYNYYDFETYIPWYVPGSATKTYMIGLVDEEVYGELENEKQPALIWKKSYGNSNVFCINGDYMESVAGIGILTAMIYDVNDYLVYPVVDSQSLVVKNYPTLSFGNEDDIMKYYGRTSSSVMENVIWPELYNISSKLDAKMTFMVPPQLNYKDNETPSIQELEYFFRLFKENGYEAGLTTQRDKNTTITEKIKSDEDFYNAFMNRYKFLTISARKSEIDELLNLDSDYISNINTIVVDNSDYKNELFAYENNSVLSINSVLSAEKYSYKQDFTQKCLNSGLAYMNVQMDLKSVLEPNEISTLWDKYVKKTTYSLTNYLSDNKYFSKCTITEADKRIRQFLALNYTETRMDDSIIINVGGYTDTARFMIRLHSEEIESITGGYYLEVEEGCYIVTSEGEQIIVKVRSAR